MKSMRYAFVAVAMLSATVAFAQDEDLPIARTTTVSEADTPLATATATAERTLSTRPLSVEITLANQSVIRGTLTDTTEFQMKSVVGEVAIPLSEVAGIRFASQEETTTTVIMLNGDSLTGATDVKVLTVETEWGAAQINGSGVSSILLVPNLQWSSVAGLNAKRWYLTEVNRAEPIRSSTMSNNRSSSSSIPSSTSRPFSVPIQSR